METTPKRTRGRLLTFREAGEITGLGERFMRRLATERRIPTYRLSPRKVRLAEQDVDDYLDIHRSPAIVDT